MRKHEDQQNHVNYYYCPVFLRDIRKSKLYLRTRCEAFDFWDFHNSMKAKINYRLKAFVHGVPFNLQPKQHQL